jgi:hypothetical protein
MAIRLKDTASIARKYAQRAQAAGPEYSNAVKDTQIDWAGPTAAAAESYNQAIQEAIGRQAFARGVAKAGTEKWRNQASSLGAARYPQGVQQAEATYAEGVAPYLETLKGLSLPPRGPAGAPQNAQRVVAVMDALHRKKVGS